MKVSYNTLNTFFDGALPTPEKVAEALTFHAWEIEGVESVGNDTILDVKVLPDKSAWALSHRGIAKDLSAILGQNLAYDPFTLPLSFESKADRVSIMLESPGCTRYAAAYVTDLKNGPSPEWLQKLLTSLGQRPISAIVDTLNYVMLISGQPLHAFDAKKLGTEAGAFRIGVRDAHEGETITTLTGETYSLTDRDMLIVDHVAQAGGLPIAVAGIKGGKHAEVDIGTCDIILEAAHFDALAVRKTSGRLRLRTDASMRYENGLVPGVVPYGMRLALQCLLDICGGCLTSYKDEDRSISLPKTASVSLSKINSVLGLTLAKDDVQDIILRFGYNHSWEGDVLTVTSSFERTDIVIPEDIIEEIGRIYGYDHVVAVVPERTELRELNTRFYYAEKIRDTLTSLGYSEIFTSSFRAEDTVAMKNAFASDKGHLRSTLTDNMKESLDKNVYNKDLLAVPAIKVFEIGTVFGEEGERYMLALGVRHLLQFSDTKDTPVLKDAIAALEASLGVTLQTSLSHGIAEIDLGALLPSLREPQTYEKRERSPEVRYASPSPYPFIARDIAFWTREGTAREAAESVVREHGGPLAVRIDCFDTFTKEGRVSYAFRIVFQSYEKTLTEEEVSVPMAAIIEAVTSQGFEVR